MLRTAVTIGCATAVAVAGVLAFRLRDTRRTPSPLTGAEPFRVRLVVTTGRTGGMLVGAYVSGLLTIGAGGRLLMRVLAATSPDEVQGLQTDAEESIGRVTVGGSVFLILFVGILGAVLGLAFFAALRRWLPDRSIVAGLAGAAIGAGALIRPTGLLDPTNPDFQLVEPVALAVAICLAMLGLFGATFGVLVDRFAATWPRPERTLKGLASLLPFAILVPSPPLLLATVVAVVAGASAPGIYTASRGRFGRMVVLALTGIGIFSIAVAAVEILTL